MGWASDRGAGGRRFDSRRAQTTFLGPLGDEFVCIFTYVGAGLGYFWGVTFGRVGVTFGRVGLTFGRVGVTFWSNLGCLGMCLGVARGRFRMGLGWFWKKCPARSENRNFQKWLGVFLLSRAARE